MEAFMKDWKGLWDQEVFEISQTHEYDDVVSEAKKQGEKTHMVRVQGLICGKNYQLNEDRHASSNGEEYYSADRSRTKTWRLRSFRTWATRRRFLMRRDGPLLWLLIWKRRADG